jgi:hypothetical protein
MVWDDLNDSELVHLARMVNPRVHRGIARSDLIALVEEEVGYELPKRGVDQAREDLFEMVNQFWSQVESLLSCPMKTRNPRACFSCTDIQVAECSLLNKKLIESIQKEESHG